MNAAFPPIPPDTESGAMVLPDEPTNNPLLKSDVIIVLPDPLGVRVRLLFAVVVISGDAPPVRVSETPLNAVVPVVPIVPNPVIELPDPFAVMLPILEMF